MACLRVFTRPPLPPFPLFNVPRLRRRIALSTVLPAALPYLRLPFLFAGMVFLFCNLRRGQIGLELAQRGAWVRENEALLVDPASTARISAVSQQSCCCFQIIQVCSENQTNRPSQWNSVQRQDFFQRSPIDECQRIQAVNAGILFLLSMSCRRLGGITNAGCRLFFASATLNLTGSGHRCIDDGKGCNRTACGDKLSNQRTAPGFELLRTGWKIGAGIKLVLRRFIDQTRGTVLRFVVNLLGCDHSICGPVGDGSSAAASIEFNALLEI